MAFCASNRPVRAARIRRAARPTEDRREAGRGAMTLGTWASWAAAWLAQRTSARRPGAPIGLSWDSSGGTGRGAGLLIFGIYWGTVSVSRREGPAMTRELDLKKKLQILMSLAAGARDGPPPPRLRHAGESGAL